MLTIAQSSARRLFELGPRIARSIRQTMRKLPTGQLTLAQYRILAHVEAGRGNASELCEIQGVSLPAMSRMVDTLVKKGLVERNSNSADRRQVLLSLSPQGRKACNELKGAVLKDMRSRVAKLNAGQQKSLEMSLGQLELLFP